MRFLGAFVPALVCPAAYPAHAEWFCVRSKSPKLLQGVGTDPKVIGRLSEAMAIGAEFEGTAINFKKCGTPFIMVWRVVPVKDSGEVVAWVAIQRQGSHV